MIHFCLSQLIVSLKASLFPLINSMFVCHAMVILCSLRKLASLRAKDLLLDKQMFNVSLLFFVFFVSSLINHSLSTVESYVPFSLSQINTEVFYFSIPKRTYIP